MEKEKELNLFKLYLISYCENDKIYTDEQLKETVNKDPKSYITDIKIANEIKEKISNARTVEEIEKIATEIHFLLKQ